MFNLIVSFSVAGAISASGASYLVQLEEHSKKVSSAYIVEAEQRFQEYERMLPGIVKKD